MKATTIIPMFVQACGKLLTACGLLAIGTLLAACSESGSSQETLIRQELEVKDSIDARRMDGAHRLIDRHMAEAQDSDTYYCWLQNKTNVYYAQMQVDSFVATTEVIHQYLLRHEGEMNATRRWLWAEWNMDRSVYFSAMTGQLDSAIVCARRAIDLMEGVKERWAMRILALTNLADYNRQAGRLDEATEVYMQALNLADSLGASDNEHIAILLGISTAYTFMNDHASSHEWWERAAQMLPRMLPADQFIYYNNRGNDYCFQQQNDSALQYFQKAASLVAGNPHTQWDYYTSCVNLGQVFNALGQTDSARLYIQRADSFYRKLDIKPILYYLDTEKMELALLEGRLGDALHMVRQPEDYGPQVPDMEVPRLKVAERVLHDGGDWRGAYEMARHRELLGDSIRGTNVRMQLSARLMQYEHDKRLLEQQRTIDRQQATTRLTWALLAVAVLAIAVLGVLLLLYRRRQQLRDLKARQQMVALRMENTRNRINPHFVFNALSHEVREQQEGRLVDFNALTMLLRRGLDQADHLCATLQEELDFVSYYVEIEGRQMGDSFHYHQEVADDIDTSRVLLPAMTLQIFVENAIKHGLRRKGGTLTIRATRQADATLVEVVDDGPGLDGRLQEHTGLRVVRQTIQLLNDHNSQHITFGIGNRPEGGCRAWLLLPNEYNYTL